MPATVDASGEWQSFQVETSPGAGVAMSVNSRAGQVRLDGPPAQVAAWRSVIEALDSPPASGDRVTKLVATKPASHDRVRKALQVLQTDSAKRGNGSPSLVATMFQPANHDGCTAAGQPPAGQSSRAAAWCNPTGSRCNTVAEHASCTRRQRANGDRCRQNGGSGRRPAWGPVQVEYVEGLDVIVLRGSERDVQRVMDIIKQIEELSAVTVPAIEIYPLKNVDSVQMGTLWNSCTNRCWRPRIGTVTITPLGTPNALLLIGRTENVKMAIDLIQRLDQPVIPTSRFEVFPLKHATATEAKTLVDEFLGQGQATTAGGGPPTAAPEQPATSSTVTPMRCRLDCRARAASHGGGRSADQFVDRDRESARHRRSGRVGRPDRYARRRCRAEGVHDRQRRCTGAHGNAPISCSPCLANRNKAVAAVTGEVVAAASTPMNRCQPRRLLGQSSPVRMQFSVDTRTNSIIAVGSREDLAVVEAILLRLDEGDLRERQTTVYRLNNAFAAECRPGAQRLAADPTPRRTAG